MALRSLLEGAGETVQDLVLAADDRYWDAYELAVQGHAFTAIYIAGFVGEMLLKTAGFLVDGALPAHPIQPRLGPARAFGRLRFPAVPHESYHSLRFWTAFLEHKRVDAGRPFDPPALMELHRRVDRVHDTWWVAMRYRAASGPSPVREVAEAEVLSMLEEVDWLRKQHTALWR